MGDANLLPYESELYGGAASSTATRFGYAWSDRTYGLGAVTMKWDDSGLGSVAVLSYCQCTHGTFSFSASKNDYHFKLMAGEYVTEVRMREGANDHITALCFRTNLRNSQWYGSSEGTMRYIRAPPSYFIHSIYGSNENGVCVNLGAYFVPLSLREAQPPSFEHVSDSEIIGSTAYDPTHWSSSNFYIGSIGAIVCEFTPGLHLLWLLCPHDYQRYLVVTDDPLPRGSHLFVLAKGELVTALRACVAHDCISAIQLDTTLRTTEWFGPIPGEKAVIETRSIKDEPSATHIGGIFAMRDPDRLLSIGVKFVKPSTS